MSRWRADRMPAVTLPPRPNGLPIASTQSPTREVSLSPQVAARQRLVGLDLQQRDIGLGVAPDELGLQIGVVVQDDGDLVGVGDHVIVGYDIARRVDDEAGAERGAPCAAAPPGGRPWARRARKSRERTPRTASPAGTEGSRGRLCSRPRSDFTVCVVEMLTTEGSSFVREIGEAVGRRPSGGGRRARVSPERRSEKQRPRSRPRGTARFEGRDDTRVNSSGAKADGCFRPIIGASVAGCIRDYERSRRASQRVSVRADIIAAPARRGRPRRRRPPAPPAARFAAEPQERAPRPASCLPGTSA